jgi:hypothetical protein
MPPTKMIFRPVICLKVQLFISLICFGGGELAASWSSEDWNELLVLMAAEN